MKPLRQQQSTAVQAAVCWPLKTVLSMNLCLLTHPALDVQRWFEEQVALHLGCLPHGSHVSDSAAA